MIDLHTHSKYSRHAVGEIDDLVIFAIRRGVKILAITDHAPFPYDTCNRLQECELADYCLTIEYARIKYAKEITILCGLEVDYSPTELNYVKELFKKVSVDYIIGSVHTIFIDNEKINIWDIEKLNNPMFIEKYFTSMAQLISSQLFDAVAHPDAILRGGISPELFKQHIMQLAPLMIKYGVAYEVNTSCMRKEKYDSGMRKKVEGDGKYLGALALPYLAHQGVKLSIGSDAHCPSDVGVDTDALLGDLLKLKGNVVYFARRQAIPITSKIHL